MFELFDQELADSSQAFASHSRPGVSHGSALASCTKTLSFVHGKSEIEVAVRKNRHICAREVDFGGKMTENSP